MGRVIIYIEDVDPNNSAEAKIKVDADPPLPEYDAIVKDYASLLPSQKLLFEFTHMVLAIMDPPENSDDEGPLKLLKKLPDETLLKN